jgi:hypothetical protein
VTETGGQRARAARPASSARVESSVLPNTSGLGTEEAQEGLVGSRRWMSGSQAELTAIAAPP